MMHVAISFCDSIIPKKPNFDFDIDITDYLTQYVSISQPNPNAFSYQYIDDHLSELLELALLDLENEYGKKAFVLLSSYPYFSNGNRFFRQFLTFISSSKVLTQECSTPVLINRIASIFSNILDNSFRIEQDAALLIIKLLPYMEHFSVFDMIQSTFKHQKYSGLRAYLKMLKFQDAIKKEFADQKMPSEKACNLLQLVSLSIDNLTLEDDFRTEEFSEVLVTFLDSTDISILNNVWQAISSLCSKDFVNKMQVFIHRALDILIQPFSELHTYHTFAMDLIGKVVLYKPDFFDSTTYQQICEIVVKVSCQYPNSVYLISSIFKLIIAMLKNAEGTVCALHNIFPLIIAESTNQTRTAFAAHSLRYLSEIVENQEKNSNILAHLSNSARFSKLYNSFLNQYIVAAKEPYGGKMSQSLSKKLQESKNNNFFSL